MAAEMTLVLVDTSAWSLLLRRQTDKRNDAIVNVLSELIVDLRVAIIGCIRQELLSGISDKALFEKLRSALAAYEDTQLGRSVYERAAEFYNICRAKGIQGSAIDFLICAAATENGWTILSTDKDFKRYAKHLPITLHEQ